MPLSQSTFVWGLLMRLLKQNRFFPLYFSKRTSGRKRFRVVPLLLRASSGVKKRCLPEPSMPKALWTFSSIIPGILSQGISEVLKTWVALMLSCLLEAPERVCTPFLTLGHTLGPAVFDLSVTGWSQTCLWRVPFRAGLFPCGGIYYGCRPCLSPPFFFFSYFWLLNLKFLHSFCHRIRFGLIHVYHFRSSRYLGFFLSCGNPNCSICFLKRGLGCRTAVLPSWSCSLEDF